MNERLRIGVAEAIGTMILVVGGPGTAILATGHFSRHQTRSASSASRSHSASACWCAAYAIGSISGCHINPAVTIGLWAIGKTKTQGLPFYIVRAGRRRHRRRRGHLRHRQRHPGASATAINGLRTAPRRTGFASNGYGIHSPAGSTSGR